MTTWLAGALGLTIGAAVAWLVTSAWWRTRSEQRLRPVRAAYLSVDRELRSLREEMTTAQGFQRFVEGLQVGAFFYRHDDKGDFLYLSPSVTHVLGYSPNEYRAHYAAMLTDHPINVAAVQHTERVLRGEQPPPYEIEVRAKDGSAHRLLVSESPVKDGDGRVRFVEGIAHDITDKHAFQARLEQLATHDELTGLCNRRAFRERSEDAVALAVRHRHPLTMAILDLDGLKRVNDTWGHAAGDLMIRGAGDVLRHELRRGDVLGRGASLAGRLGGDEFAALLPFTGAAQCQIAMERVLVAFRSTRIQVHQGDVVELAASVGIAELTPGMSVAELEARADHALYRSKRGGRDRVTVWSENAD